MTAGLMFLNGRRSVPARQLEAPAPDAAVLERMLAAAVRVPDHGKRVPWRFVRIAGDARATLGEALVARALERDPDAGAAVLDKDRNRFHAPLAIAVVAQLGPDEKIPEAERFASACCACFAPTYASKSALSCASHCAHHGKSLFRMSASGVSLFTQREYAARQVAFAGKRLLVAEKPSSCRMRFIRSALSSLS